MLYSGRGANPLDPRQFNGYATAAGPEPHASSSFNPRFSAFGLTGGAQDGDQAVQGRFGFDFNSTRHPGLYDRGYRGNFGASCWPGKLGAGTGGPRSKTQRISAENAARRSHLPSARRRRKTEPGMLTSSPSA
jgi:hypothetical protein